jgi:hypothetical protein
MEPVHPDLFPIGAVPAAEAFWLRYLIAFEVVLLVMHEYAMGLIYFWWRWELSILSFRLLWEQSNAFLSLTSVTQLCLRGTGQCVGSHLQECCPSQINLFAQRDNREMRQPSG